MLPKKDDSNLKRFFVSISNYLLKNVKSRKIDICNDVFINDKVSELPSNKVLEFALANKIDNDDIKKMLLFTLEDT